MNEKKQSKIDVAVLMIFFCRVEKTREVFEAVKKARPSKLYLYQDGAREFVESDKANIEKCREVVADIDWDCEVHKLYQEKNYGCDPSEYIAQRWFFDNEECGIVLEDDDVPAQAFFPFCKELLERYKDNEKINMICGMNNNDVSKDIKESYLFTKLGSIWGWASWRRVIDTWDKDYRWLDDPAKIAIIKKNYCKYCDFEGYLNVAREHRSTGRAHYESINAAAMYLYDRVNIVPKYNMIKNIGIDQESTHAVADIRLLPKRTQKLLYKKVYEIDFPLIHPKNIEINEKFERKMTPTKFQRKCDSIEGALRVLRYKGVKGLKQKIKKHNERKRG